MLITNNKIVGAKIKKCRTNKHLTQKELGKLIGKSEITIRKYESGDIQIPNSVLKIIAETLNVLIWDLMDFEEVETNLRSYFAFEKYLQSIGYVVKSEKVKESKSGYWEEHKDDNGKTIGQSWIPDEEFYEVTLTKDGKSITFTDEEFKLLHETINKTIEYQIWLKTNKK
ncbi:MAG: helix-turn-helix transcriptional regulator [Acidaminococcaceae bacterium]